MAVLGGSLGMAQKAQKQRLRRVYARARRCPMTGEKLAGVNTEYLDKEEGTLAIESIIEDTHDTALMNDIGGTVVGRAQWRRYVGTTLKYLNGVLLPNSYYHAYRIQIGPNKWILASHVNSISAGTDRRKRW